MVTCHRLHNVAGRVWYGRGLNMGTGLGICRYMVMDGGGMGASVSRV